MEKCVITFNTPLMPNSQVSQVNGNPHLDTLTYSLTSHIPGEPSRAFVLKKPNPFPHTHSSDELLQRKHINSIFNLLLLYQCVPCQIAGRRGKTKADKKGKYIPLYKMQGPPFGTEHD